MHQIIEDGLEDYLAGRVLRDFEMHLGQCPPCQSELAEFHAVSLLFRESLAIPKEQVDVPVPSPGFYTRLSGHLEAKLEAKKAASPWNFFSLNAAFGRRVVFASLMTLAGVGGYVISRESNISPDLQGPEAIIASHDVEAPHETSVERDRMMVTLASYER